MYVYKYFITCTSLPLGKKYIHTQVAVDDDDGHERRRRRRGSTNLGLSVGSMRHGADPCLRT